MICSAVVAFSLARAKQSKCCHSHRCEGDRLASFFISQDANKKRIIAECPKHFGAVRYHKEMFNTSKHGVSFLFFFAVVMRRKAYMYPGVEMNEPVRVLLYWS